MSVWKKLKSLIADAAPATGLVFAVCGMVAVWVEQSLTGAIFPQALLVGAGIMGAWGLFRLIIKPSDEPPSDQPPILVLLSSARTVPLWSGAICLLLISRLLH